MDINDIYNIDRDPPECIPIGHMREPGMDKLVSKHESTNEYLLPILS